MRRWPGSRWPPGACRQDAVGRSGALSRRGWVLFTLVGVIWGVPYLLIKVADGGVSVPVLVFARTAIGALLLLPLAARRREIGAALAHWGWLAVFALVEVILPWAFLSDAEHHLASPFAALAWPHAVPSANVLASIATLGVVCTGAAFVLFFALIGEVGPARATVITYVNPAVAVGLGVAVLGERLTPAIAASFVLILAGSYFATRSGRKGTPSPAAEQADPVAVAAASSSAPRATPSADSAGIPAGIPG